MKFKEKFTRGNFSNSSLRRTDTMMDNKKALSAVVATVMIIALTISAAGIIMKFAVPFVKDGLAKSTECVEFQEYYKFNEDVGISTNCLKSDDDLLISVSAQNLGAGDNEVKGFNLVLFEEGFSKVIKVQNGESSDVELVDYNDGVIEIPGPGETRTYRHENSARDGFLFAELTPILKNDKICERRSDRISIRRCA